MKEDIYSKGRMPHHNKEGFTDFDINPDWYKNRKPGISAMMRSFKDERWIGPAVESIIDFVDEIVVAFTDGGDRTRKILESFNSPKIKICEYPFKLKINVRDWQSVYNLAYFSNWGLSKTTYSHYSPWDADMILIPYLNSKNNHDFILTQKVMHWKGYNVATPDFKYMSKNMPYITHDIRFIELNKHIFYECTKQDHEEWTYRGIPQLLTPKRWFTHTHVQFQLIFNKLSMKDVKYPVPLYFHTKPLIMAEGTEKEKSSHTVGSQYIGTAKKGQPINEEIPDFVFKKPEDYL